MADAAKRLIGPQLLTAAAATYYTVPGSTQAILRNIQVVNVTAASATFTMSIGTDGTGTRLFAGSTIVPGGVLSWTGFIVLNAADILQAYGSTASALTATISGVEVS